MKIIEILTEAAPIVMGYRTEFDKEFDTHYNPQSDMIANLNREYYKKYFREFLNNGTTPVFTKSDNYPPNDNDREWSNKPDPDTLQSPGYRGQQGALHKAGVPHDTGVASHNTAPPIPLTPRNLDL